LANQGGTTENPFVPDMDGGVFIYLTPLPGAKTAPPLPPLPTLKFASGEGGRGRG